MEGESLGSVLFSAALIVGLTILGLALVQMLGRRAVRAIQEMHHVREARRQQLVTFAHIVQWGVHIVILVSTVLMLLSTFGVDITPLLASAGVAGLAVSLGAQTLIKDFIGGILILVENQFTVGDAVQMGSVSGIVERLTLRATYVRGVDGSLYVVPNGEVRIVANQTKDWSRALVDIGVAYEADLERALTVLEEGAAAFAQDPRFGVKLLEPPTILGPLALGDSTITVRVMVKTPPGQQWEVARELRKWILATCEREGIELPYPRQEVWVRGSASTAVPTNKSKGGKDEK